MNAVSAVAHPRPPEEAPAVDPDRVLAALDNPTSRRILGALDDEPRTAAELSERSGVPLSTIYRHLDALADARLALESLRLSPDGRHAAAYARAISDVVITLGGDADLSVTVR